MLPADQPLDQFAVLQDRDQIFDGRAAMTAAGVDFAQSPIYPAHVRPDVIKSWDVWRTVSLIRQTTDPAAGRVLDLGCFACEIVPALDRFGFSDLHGIDLNPQVSDMPAASRATYHVGDMMAAPFEDGSVNAISAISTIEHGFDQPRLLAEVSRLLTPGGHFVFSTDYWPEKIDTAEVQQWFNLDWTIFSAQDIKAFIAQAADVGLAPVLPVTDELLETVDDQPVHWHKRDYTFLYGVLRKDA
jgi:SAM-dependent methyltransferase